MKTRDTDPAAALLRGLSRLVSRHARSARDLPAVHIPAAFGDQPPPTDHTFYQPLTRLDLEYHLYAGVADHHDPQVSHEALRLFEATAGRLAEAVGTACGMGREPEELATRAAAICRDLAKARSPFAENLP